MYKRSVVAIPFKVNSTALAHTHPLAAMPNPEHVNYAIMTQGAAVRGTALTLIH